jgi:excisionase family DNA binding protein
MQRFRRLTSPRSTKTFVRTRWTKLDIIDNDQHDPGMPLLGVREAARRLGVHENTLRRWEKAGLIRAVKLPTGVRRFREEDVERLHADMHRAVADAESEPPASPR